MSVRYVFRCERSKELWVHDVYSSTGVEHSVFCWLRPREVQPPPGTSATDGWTHGAVLSSGVPGGFWCRCDGGFCAVGVVAEDVEISEFE